MACPEAAEVLAHRRVEAILLAKRGASSWNQISKHFRKLVPAKAGQLYGHLAPSVGRTGASALDLHQDGSKVGPRWWDLIVTDDRLPGLLLPKGGPVRYLLGPKHAQFPGRRKQSGPTPALGIDDACPRKARLDHPLQVQFRRQRTTPVHRRPRTGAGPLHRRARQCARTRNFHLTTSLQRLARPARALAVGEAIRVHESLGTMAVR